jgi:hypothetical protein
MNSRVKVENEELARTIYLLLREIIYVHNFSI